MTKVLLVVENYSAPADTRVWLEARTLRDAGYGVSVISPRGATRDRERFEVVEGIPIYRYTLPEAGSFAGYLVEYAVALWMTFWLALRVWRRHGFDVLHVANPPDIFFVLALLFKPFGKRFVFDQHDLTPELFAVRFDGRADQVARVALRAQRGMERLSFRVAALAVVANESFRRRAIEGHEAEPERVHVVRNAPDPLRIARVAPEPALKGEWRSLLAYVGVMGPQDGVEYAIRALDDLVHRQGRSDVGLVLLGDGAELPALRALAAELQLERNVNFTGWVEASTVARYLSTAEVGLCPDPQNGLNEHCTTIKALEYMALGLPMVAFDLAETRFSAGDAALYAPPNSVEEFAKRIATLLDDAALRERMGTCGRERLATTLSREHSQRNLLAAYAQCLPQRAQEPREREERGISPAMVAVGVGVLVAALNVLRVRRTRAPRGR